VTPYGWEGNRRSGVALAMCHRLCGFFHLRAQGLSIGDERPANASLEVRHPLLQWSSTAAVYAVVMCLSVASRRCTKMAKPSITQTICTTKSLCHATHGSRMVAFTRHYAIGRSRWTAAAVVTADTRRRSEQTRRSGRLPAQRAHGRTSSHHAAWRLVLYDVAHGH